MEVDSCQEHSDFDMRGGKRRRFGDAGASRSLKTVKGGITHAESTALINSHFQREKSGRVISFDTEGGLMSQALIVPHLDKEEKEKFQEVAKESILSIPGASDFVTYGVIGGTLDGQNSKVLASKDGIRELGRFLRDSFKSAEAGNLSTISNCASIESGPNPSITGQAQTEYAIGVSKSSPKPGKEIPEKKRNDSGDHLDVAVKENQLNSSRCAQHLSMMGPDLTHHEK
ncbi:hypothetical protein ACLB2K_022669 [Fragaria x ananassa]